MERLHIHIPEKTKDALTKLAEDRGVSVGELVRAALTQFMAREQRKEK